MSNPPAPPDLSQRLTLIIHALRHMIAAHAGRNRGAAPIVLRVWPYLHRLAMRFEALVRRVRAGGPAPANPRPRPACLAPRPRPPRLPGGFAWLIRLAPQTAQLGGQLHHLLADPELAALLTASPQAGRILRPLCRMLGILPDPGLPAALFPPRAPRRSPQTRAVLSPAPDRPPSPEPSAQQRPAQARRPLVRAAPA